jgi:CMP-N-acetylneuraminic acid synthetase/mannose-6-phosphate isomerase-like protein (cupin superfamily)
MKKIAMIPARLGSKRVPKKNLRLILGKPLVAYILEAAKASGVFDEIYLNSEAEIFKEIADEYGVKFYHRDEKLSTDKTINDEFALDFIENVPCDICVQLLPTSPLVKPQEIKAFVDGMIEGHYETYISVVRHQIAAIFREAPINFSRTERHRSSQEMDPVYSYATVFMGWDTKRFKMNMEEIGSAYHGGGGKVGYFEVSGLSTIDIDEEDDFVLAEEALRARYAGRKSDVSYYEPKRSHVGEVDVPMILKRDGVMRSDFGNENLPVTDIEKIIEEQDSSTSWSWRVVNSDSNSATVISQLPGEGNRLHYHPDWNEWWLILRGAWKWKIGDEERIIKTGELVFIPKNTWHKITAVGDEPAVRLAVSRADVEHIYHVEDSPEEGRA